MIAPAPRYGRVTPADWIRSRKPPPGLREGAYWRGLDFQTLLKSIVLGVQARGWKHETTRAALFDRGGGLAASVLVRPPTWAHAEFTPALGVVATNLRREGRRYYCGLASDAGGVVTARWGAPDRRMVSGHTYDLLTETEEAWDRWEQEAKKLPAMITQLDSMALTAGQAEVLLARAALDGLTTPGRSLNAVQGFWRADRQTAWKLLKEFGRVAGGNPPRRQMDDLLRFYTDVDKLAKSLMESQLD